MPDLWAEPDCCEGVHVRCLSIIPAVFFCWSGTDEGGAGASSSVGVGARVAAMLKGRKASADRIVNEGVDEARLQAAARATVGFSGELSTHTSLIIISVSWFIHPVP